ncbi:hypothetical protein HMN09_00866300 [Mycena chlorophos]|uniref:Uncharacterized protein n=1 Tax=Mycena chlorophos TaxID=658473 RepID=A0A8H6W296_MYCCL|nr:hypothetical protein HMN09_00866300 [Mycena chlorophos]
METKQRKTGVKDAYTQYWILGLIDRHKQLRISDPERDIAEIKAELRKHAVLQKLLGWTPQPTVRPGDIKLVSLKHGEKTRTAHPLINTLAAKAVNFADFAADSAWDRCKSVTAQSGDECVDGSWIFATLPSDSSILFPARIAEIWKGVRSNILIVERFQSSSSRDPAYG